MKIRKACEIFFISALFSNLCFAMDEPPASEPKDTLSDDQLGQLITEISNPTDSPPKKIESLFENSFKNNNLEHLEIIIALYPDSKLPKNSSLSVTNLVFKCLKHAD